MNNKRQIFLPLLAAATAIMVSPHANAVTWNYPVSISGSTVFNPATTITMANAAGDIFNIDSGSAIVVSPSAGVTFGDSIINIKAGSMMSTALAGPVFVAGIGSTTTATFNINGTVQNSGSNPAINAGPRTGVAGIVAVNINTGGVVNGDITPAFGNAGAVTNIVVNGTWNGGLTQVAVATAASSLTVSGGTINTGATGINTANTINTFTLRMNRNSKIVGNVVAANAGGILVLNADTGSSIIQGNVTAVANTGSLNLGLVDNISSSNLTITGTLDALRMTQTVPGTLTIMGNTGATTALGAVTLNAGVANFMGTFGGTTVANTGYNVSNFTGNVVTSSTFAVSSNAVVNCTRNLTTGGALTVGDSGVLTVNGTTAITGAFATSTTMNTGAVANFYGNFSTTTTLTSVANTTINFYNNATIGTTSTIAGNVNVLGPTFTLTGNLTAITGNLIIGSAAGTPVAISGAGTIGGVTAGVLRLNQGVSLVAANTITATGGLIQIGKSVSVPGAISVTAGATLELFPGSSLSAALTSTNGIIKVRGSVANNGVITNVTYANAGAYMAGAGTTQIVFENSANYGQLNVSAAAALNATANFNVLHTGGYVAPGQYQVLLSPNGTLTAITTGVTSISTASKTTTFSVDYGNITTRVVTVTATRATPYTNFATDNNVRGFLGAIDSITPLTYQAASAGTQATLNYVEQTVSSGMSPAEVNLALQPFMPNVSNLAASRSVTKNTVSTLGQRLESIGYDMRNPREYVAGDTDGSGLWFRGTFSRVSQKLDTSSNYSGFTSHQIGTIVGFDTKRFKNATFGLGLGYSSTRVKDKLNPFSATTIKSYQFMPYGSVDFSAKKNRGFIDWFLGYTYNNIRGTRMVAPISGVAYSAYNSSILSAKLLYGYDKVISKRIMLVPFVSMLNTYQPSVTYAETGSAAQSVQNPARLGIEFELGLKGVFRPFPDDKIDTRIVFRAMSVWTPSNSLKVVGTLIGGQNYTYSVNQEKLGFRTGLTAVLELANDFDVEMSYDIEFRTKCKIQAGFVEFKYNF